MIKLFLSAITIFLIIGNEAFASCDFNSPEYRRTYKDDYHLLVKNEGDFLNENRHYKCHIIYKKSEDTYSKTMFKCSDKIIISKTKYELISGVQTTWVLMDKNENTFLLDEQSFYQDYYTSGSYINCDQMIHESSSNLRFDNTVNYSGNTFFIFKTLRNYVLNKTSRPIPDF